MAENYKIIETDVQNEFIEKFGFMIDFYNKFIGGQKKYFTWLVLSLHMTLHSLFVLFLKESIGYSVIYKGYKEGEKKEYKIYEFEQLWKKVKEVKEGKYGININLPKKDIVKKRTKAIRFLNKKRNDIVHFKPESKAWFVFDDFDVGFICLDIIKHILTKCKINNIKNTEEMKINVSSIFFSIDVDDLIEKIKKIKNYQK